MSDRCVINYASGWFVRGQERLHKAFLDVGYKGDFLFYNDKNVLQCPPQSVVPYGFKPYAMKEAQKKGYRYILWCDASVFPEKPVEPAFEIIREIGYLLLPGGWNTGQWCSDAALETLGINREEAFDIPHLMACCMGLDLQNETSIKFLDKYFEMANDGITFHGAWTNENGQVSSDKRVLGHRHDQTAASVISWQLGMRDWRTHILIYDETGDTPRTDKTIFVLRHVG